MKCWEMNPFHPRSPDGSFTAAHYLRSGKFDLLKYEDLLPVNLGMPVACSPVSSRDEYIKPYGIPCKEVESIAMLLSCPFSRLVSTDACFASTTCLYREVFSQVLEKSHVFFLDPNIAGWKASGM